MSEICDGVQVLVGKLGKRRIEALRAPLYMYPTFCGRKEGEPA